jgi:hypothetical protein
MSRMRVHIDHIAVRGLDAAAADAAIEGLRLELARLLREPSALPARPQRTPVMKVGPVPLRTGSAGARQLGVSAAGAIARKVRPQRASGKFGGSG